MPTTDELYQEANCYTCLGISQVEALKLALEARWLLALDPTADTSADALLQYANCFGCNSNASMADLIELALLDQIAAAA